MFRVFSNLHRCYLDKIFRNGNIKDKIGDISKESIYIEEFKCNAFKLLNIRYQGDLLGCNTLTLPN